MGLIIVIHAIICALLIIIILIQRGRGGGLVESFSGVESMFGTKTNTFLTRTTTILSILFFLTCLSLALLSARQSRSLMRQVNPAKTEGKTTVTQPLIPAEETITEPAKTETKPEAPKTE
jgi:preprotein translocase subunit SecG